MYSLQNQIIHFGTQRQTITQKMPSRHMPVFLKQCEEMVDLFKAFKNNFIHDTYCDVILFLSVQPQIEVPNNLIGAPIGSHITLRCQIEASPKPITYWRRKGIFLYSIQNTITGLASLIIRSLRSFKNSDPLIPKVLIL